MFFFEFIIVGFILACFTLFLNYCMGKPGSEFSPYEIFSSYTVWLSIRRLKEVDLYHSYVSQYNDSIQRAETKHEILTINNDFKKIIYNAADPYFTWERAIGMCPICFGFWVSLIGGIGYILYDLLKIQFAVNFDLIFFTKNFVILLIIVVNSHITIRLLSKAI